MDVASADAAATALSTAIKNEAVAAGQSVEDRTAAKAPGLATGAFEQGGYTYNRVMAPIVPVITSALVTAAKQAVFRQSAKNAINEAQIAYDNSKAAMNQRQRDAQKKAAEEARRQRAAYDAAIKAYQRAAAGGGGGAKAVTTAAGTRSTVSGIKTVSTGAPANLTVSAGKQPTSLAMGKVTPQKTLTVSTAKPQTSLSVGTVKKQTLSMGK